MARMRSIKPEFFTDSDLAEFSPLHRILYAGLWCHEDRAGRVEDKPRQLKVRILPFDKCDVDRMLQDLHDEGFIIRYEVDGVRYLCTPTFLKHQRPHITERASQLPPPPEGPGPNGGLTVKEPTRNGEVTVIHTSGNGAGTGGQPSENGYETPGAGAGAGAGALTSSLPSSPNLRLVPPADAVPRGEEGDQLELEEFFPDTVALIATWQALRQEFGLDTEHVDRKTARRAEEVRGDYTAPQWQAGMRRFLDPKASKGAGWAEDDWPLCALLTESLLRKKLPARPARAILCGSCGELASTNGAGQPIRTAVGKATCYSCLAAPTSSGGAV